jgi:hypothetical protein
MQRTKRALAGTALLVGLGILTPALAQEAAILGSQEKSVRIVRTASPPVIDGSLDEAVWATAAMVDDLHEIQPTEYDEPSERTVVLLLYDDDTLYIGARMYDREPGLITDRILRQGEQVFGDDWFSVMLDTFHDRRSGYRFFTNPNGIRQEGLYQNVTDSLWDWTTIWEAAAKIDDEGWTAELAIPFKSISFDPHADTWGINFRRAIARRDERFGWVSRNRNTDPSTSGIVVGLEGLEQGRGLDVVPSVSVSDRRIVGASEGDSELDPSLDVFYKITPNMTGTLTLNTDFSATEVDDRQVNLTRFGLFFPEKRDFFLQDADIFEFGGIDQNGRPFFSRRIGLANDGNPVDLEVGGKLSGRIGRFNVGALAIRQDEYQGVASDNAVVARVSANVLDESTIGLIATEGDPQTNLDNSVAGIDFSYRNTRLPGRRTLEVGAFAQKSDTEGIEGEDGSRGFRVRMPNSTGFRGGLGVTEIEENFNPALGFVNRSGIRQGFFSTEYITRPSDGFLRSIMGGINLQRVDRLAGGMESERFTLRMIELESRFGDELRFRRSTRKESLIEPFEISDGITIPVGLYEYDDLTLDLSTADQRRIWGRLNVQSGDFFTGTRNSIEPSISWRPSGRFFTELSYEYNDIDLAEGSFETRLTQFRTEVVFSSTLSWVTLIQYDNVSETIGINSRVHWVPEAGREAYLVVNHNLQDLDRNDSFHSSFSELAIKFNYTYRF